MSIDNLDIVKRLIAEKECGRVEFKETTGQLERGMETLCAFLNGEGGTVLFGVTDKGKIIGQDVSDKTKRDIADAVWRIEPFATVEVSYTEIPDTGKSVIALSAEEQRYMRPFSYKGRAYQRVESATSTMPQEMYNQYLIQRGGKYAWEAITNPDLKISDLGNLDVAPLPGDLIQDGAHHPARGAPGGPEVQQDGAVGIQHFALEIISVDMDH